MQHFQQSLDFEFESVDDGLVIRLICVPALSNMFDISSVKYSFDVLVIVVVDVDTTDAQYKPFYGAMIVVNWLKLIFSVCFVLNDMRLYKESNFGK